MAKNHKTKEQKAKEQQYVYGFHAIMPIVQHQPEQIKKLYILRSRDDNRMQSLIEAAQQAHISIEFLQKEALQKIIGSTSHQGVVAILNEVSLPGEKAFYAFLHDRQSPFILVLDQVQDPHNLGACLRTAYCAGIDAVILPKHGACPVNATVRKVAAGAVERLSIFEVTNLRRVLEKMRDEQIWLAATSDKATQQYHKIDYTGGIAIIMGAEGSGVRDLTAKQCDYLVSIPMSGDDVSSLNVSVATGVILFEAKRQRGDLG